MKNFVSKLFILALGVTALSGCDLFTAVSGSTKGDEEHEVKGLVLKDYSNTVVQDSNYKFDGKVYLNYVDESIPQYEVTKDCTFSTINTATIGDKTLTVKYEGSKYVYSKSVIINVAKKVTLQSIKVEDGYVSTVKKGQSFVFIGTVTATYDNETTENVTTQISVDTSSLNTNVAGKYPVKISFTKDGKTAQTSFEVTVIDLKKIEVKNYTSLVKKGDTYSFDGTVVATYTDDSTETVTEKCEVDTSAVNVDQIGKYNVVVTFTECGTTLNTSIEVSVYVDRPKLSKIEAKNYTNTIEKGTNYTFDGVVVATFEDNTTETVTDQCSYGSISTLSPGNKSLTITYTTTYTVNGREYTNSKSTSALITVISILQSISGTDLNLGVGRTKKINLTFSPSDATNKNVTYVSTDPSIASVNSNGEVTGEHIGNTTITVTSELSSSITATINIEVVEIQNAAWTILVYMCGSNLESEYADSNEGCATDDLREIASVNGQPDDVNIVVQAGGAEKWSSQYSSVISAGKRNRFHLKNKNYVLDSQDDAVNMGSYSTLQDFITWGITKYPADNIGIVFWNHGGAIRGCCFDDEFSGNGLDPYEMATGIKNARTALGYTKKFEFVGYDCCLMQFHDLVGLNAEYARYQIASEESEWGAGWSYDGWVDDLFAKKSTTDILTEIVDSFGNYTTTVYNYYNQPNNQTLSFVDLAYWSAYETAWENMSSTLSGIINSNNKWLTLAGVLSDCKKYGDDYDLYDVGDFCNKMKASTSPYKNNSTLMSRITNIQTARSNLVAHEFHGNGAGNSSGLALFAPVSKGLIREWYPSTITTLETWRTICVNYGSWYY